MEFIVCNGCGCSPSKRQFFITACSHVFCETCRTTPTADFCHLCKIPTKTLKMDASLPKNVKKMFGDVGVMSTDIHKRLARVIGFQKIQKSIQLKMENKKSVMRKEQTKKVEKKTEEMHCQLSKLTSFEENNRKKLEDIERENEKLRNLISALELKVASSRDIDDDEFFMQGTPTSSNPSVAGSDVDNDELLDYDLLGLRNRSDSSSSNCSSQSNRGGSLF